jgi:iron complex outermembrane receptor protein
LRTNTGPVSGAVPSYFELDTRIGWHLSQRLELSIVGQNLLHDHHPEYGFPSPARVEIQRGVYGKIAWQY